MISKFKQKLMILFISILFITGCGDFPDYGYDQSEDYCVISFPFAGGIIGREYVGYFRIVSSLQFLDADPEYMVFATGPSNIELEAGSFQKLIINDKVFTPKFEPDHLEAELELWGPAFLFTDEESTEIYDLIKQGHDLEIHGRLEVGHQYETKVYNFFFDSANERFRKCINRLLDEQDLQSLNLSK